MCLFLIRPSPRRFARGLGPGPRNGCCPDQWLLLRSSLLKLSGFSHCAIPRTFIQLHFFGNDINELRQSQLNEFASWLRWVLDLAVGVTKMHMWLKRYWHFVCAMGPPTLQPHGPGQLDLLYQIAAAGRSETNACRNLHSLIHKRGLTLPLKIHTVEVPVRKGNPRFERLGFITLWFCRQHGQNICWRVIAFCSLGGMISTMVLGKESLLCSGKPIWKLMQTIQWWNLGHLLQRERCLSTSMGMRVVENTDYLSWSRPYRQLWALKGRPSRIQVGNSSQKVFYQSLHICM